MGRKSAAKTTTGSIKHLSKLLSDLRGRSNTHDETGSSLILALVFLIVSSLIVLSLSSLATNDLNNASQFKLAQSRQSTADSAVELAIEKVRYNFMPQTLNASPPQSCWNSDSTPSQVSLNNQNIDVWCSTRWAPLSTKTRVVTFFACQSTVTAAQCGTTPLLYAVVTFDDYPSPIEPISTAQCTTTCGESMDINSWIFNDTPPTVTAISPTSGSSSGGSGMTITGTNFAAGATVQFVNTSLSSNSIIQATSVDVVNATTITANWPALSSGTPYYVTVTTAEGTSQYGPTFN